MPCISVVVPVYKNIQTLAELHALLVDHVGSITSDFELIFVDDGCPQGSWDVIAHLAEIDRRVRGVRLSKNFGQHRALTAGLDMATGDWVVIMDADLQDHPRYIPDLYATAVKGMWPVVVARCRERTDAPMLRILSLAFYRLLSYLSGAPFDPMVGNFRIMSRTVVDAIGQYREQFRLISGIVSLTGFRTTCVEVERPRRRAGKTSYNIARRASLAVDCIIAYSDKPLRISTFLGFVLACGSFIAGIYLILSALMGHPPPGWASVIVSLYFIGGCIIANLGVIGHYLARTYNEAKHRPLYVIAETTTAAGTDT
ncbi:MAG: glycosyltransferase family 2 protein [Magnetococcales bacterium]|nr:glycosyltransferase family 2 protein [Magnetococcales bacterium]